MSSPHQPKTNDLNKHDIAESSVRVVYAALAGNVLVAVSKFAAAAVSGSTAMLTEAIHSSCDCANQLLLLVGVRRGKLPSDPSHQFGYGMEIYFWTFVVAVLVLCGGGIFSIVEGISELRSPHPITAPAVSLGVLFLSAVFEGASFSIAYRQFRAIVARHRLPGETVSLVQFIKWSKDPSLYESLLEDGAALVGLAVAAAGIVASVSFGFLPADGIASLIIGMMLVMNAAAILIATRSLVAGESVAPPILRELTQGLAGHRWSDRISSLSTLHLGPSCILAAVTLRAVPDGALDAELLREIETKLMKAEPRIREVLFRY
jgi:cation diffusion facilitator family transporter